MSTVEQRAEWRQPMTDNGGWTSHGHPIPGQLLDPAKKPARVMRCGGARLCKTCKREAGDLGDVRG